MLLDKWVVRYRSEHISKKPAKDLHILTCIFKCLLQAGEQLLGVVSDPKYIITDVFKLFPNFEVLQDLEYRRFYLVSWGSLYS